MTEDLEAALRSATELFDACRYHDAHELLDGLWEATSGKDADFLKGLIQACIAMHHFQRGNLEGARKLYSGHRRYLGAYLPAYRGLDLTAFLGEMQRALHAVVRPTPGSEALFDPAQRPRLPWKQED